MKKSGAELPRPYKCPICDKAFYRLEHQTRHIRTHTGEKPHVCTFPGCTKRFSRSDELTRHSRIHSNPNSRRNRKEEAPAPASAAPPATSQSQAQAQAAPQPTTPTPAHQQIQQIQPVKTPAASPPMPQAMFSAPGSPMPIPPQVQAQLPQMPFNRTNSSTNISASHLSRWSSNSQYDIHALANTATQMLEQERRGTSTNQNPHPPSSSSHFNRQRSTPALASYFHHHAQMGPYDRSARLDPLTPLHNSAANTVPNSPAVSRPASPSPESTPLATPGHSPHFGPQDGVQLPAIRSLPLSRFGGTHPVLHPMEPTAQPFSGIRTTLELPAFNLSNPATPLVQSPAVSRAASPPPRAPPTSHPSRVSVSDLVNPVKIEN